MTDRYPDGYNTDGLAPIINIYDQNLQLQYTYEHPQLVDFPQQDFVLNEWAISLGLNSKVGNCRIVIEDHDDQLTDGNGNPIIQTGWHIQISLGKSSDDLAPWFFGIINEPEIDRPSYGQQYAQIPAFGYAHVLSTRFVTIKHEQKRDDETGKLDNTDMSACVSELVKQVFADDSLIIPPHDPNLTLNGIEPIDIKLANLDKNNQSQGIVLSELANVVNAVYGITPDLDFYFHGVQKHGGYIVTNGNTDNIDVDKLMIARNKPYNVKNTIVRKAFTSLIGVDLTLSLDILKDTGGASLLSLTSGSWDEYGFRIPHTDKIGKLQILLRRTGNAGPLEWDVRSSTSSTRHGNTDGESERTGTISAEDLTAALTLNENKWLEISLNLDATDNTNDRIMWFNSGFDNISVLYDASAAGEIFKTLSSSSNVNNRRRVESDGKPRFRIFGEPEQTLLIAENLSLYGKQQHKEQMQYLSGTPQSETATALFEGLMDQAGQQRRVWQITASAPSTRPPLGQQCRLVDTFNGMDTDALLIGYDISGDRANKLTAIDINLELERYL